MPIGCMVNSGAVLFGGLLGGVIGKRIAPNITEALNWTMGVISLILGISLAVTAQSISAVALALIAGTIIGELLGIERGVLFAAKWAQRKFFRTQNKMGEEETSLLVGALVLFCASGTGIFGALREGASGDASILILKATLDFFTAMIFAAKIGVLVSGIAIPQFAIFMLLFCGANLIMPFIADTQLLDFKACGGAITLCIGLKILELKPMRVANLLPAFVFVIPMSALWEFLFL